MPGINLKMEVVNNKLLYKTESFDDDSNKIPLATTSSIYSV